MVYCIVLVFFFFKQKTAYEMRISDWSSDVCSSDLLGVPGDARPGHSPTRHRVGGTVLMWYFAWILGLALACSVGILNAIWYEVQSDQAHGRTGPFNQP